MESSFLFAGGIFSQTEESEYHPRYTAILQRALSLGYSIPSTGCQQIQNDLMIALVNSGAIDEMDRFYVPANDSGANFSTIDWVHPSTSPLATLVNSPTWTTKIGFEQGGGTSYINTGYAPASGVKYLLNDGSLGAYLKGTISLPNGTSVIAAILTGSAHIFIGRNANNVGRLEARINGDGNGGVTWSTIDQYESNTLYASVRENSVGLKMYRRGLLYNTSVASPSTSIPTGNLFLMARNSNGSPTLYLPASIQLSMFYIGSSLVPQASLNSSFQTYMTELATL